MVVPKGVGWAHYNLLGASAEQGNLSRKKYFGFKFGSITALLSNCESNLQGTILDVDYFDVYMRSYDFQRICIRIMASR